VKVLSGDPLALVELCVCLNHHNQLLHGKCESGFAAGLQFLALSRSVSATAAAAAPSAAVPGPWSSTRKESSRAPVGQIICTLINSRCNHNARCIRRRAHRFILCLCCVAGAVVLCCSGADPGGHLLHAGTRVQRRTCDRAHALRTATSCRSM
jgi:hypothetical protein